MLHFSPSNSELEKNCEVIMSMEGMADTAVETFLVDAETTWQPSDFLPDMSTGEGFDALKNLQERAGSLPGEVISSLVGNMITEEALPTYQTFLT